MDEEVNRDKNGEADRMNLEVDKLLTSAFCRGLKTSFPSRLQLYSLSVLHLYRLMYHDLMVGGLA